MNRITPLLIPMAVALLTTSCSKEMIQVATVKPVSNKIKDAKDNYIFENDTVKITYAFWASQGKFEFTIENKLNKPIYIDWKKSNLVYNDSPNVYWTDETKVNSKSVSTGVAFRGAYNMSVGSSVTSEEAIIRPKERITFLPPASRITRNEYAIENAQYYLMDLNTQGDPVRHAADERKMTTTYNQTLSLIHI